jgi:hypothetical protein|tara:strand:- start:534 stop:638 length:105 start_codon:yes stop_codon:yes gene_type:complete
MTGFGGLLVQSVVAGAVIGSFFKSVVKLPTLIVK